ncbi:MAG: hypothetical protein IIC90_13500 [Chloroflexi bacterium]|nr:hypothetical protein [Chloroflexota bacterium]
MEHFGIHELRAGQPWWTAYALVEQDCIFEVSLGIVPAAHGSSEFTEAM